MKKSLYIIAALVGITLAAANLTAWHQQPDAPPPPAAQEDGISVYFSPNGGCTEAIIHEITQAQNTIDVLAYSFTAAPIAKALLRARDRGVTVRIVLDKSQRTATYSSATFFHNQKMDVYIDSAHAIQHNKVMLIDGQTIITGSFNFSGAAEERNAENLLIIRDRLTLAKAYADEFEHHIDHSERYTRPDDVPEPVFDSDGNKLVYVTRGGQRYHTVRCRHASGAEEVTVEEAKKRGLTPCAICRP